MSESDRPPTAAPVNANAIEQLLKRLAKGWADLKKADKELDLKSLGRILTELDRLCQALPETWQTYQTMLETEMLKKQTFLRSPDYPRQIEAALTQAKITFKGEFPNYDIPPFKLVFSLESQTIALKLGRKMIGGEPQRIFEPSLLATWVAKQHQKIRDNDFKPDRLCQELLTVYQMANQFIFKKDTPDWGAPIPLKEIYHFLTLKQSVRQDYPESLFFYELGQLKEQVDLSYAGHRFEFVPSRNAADNVILVDRQGRESRVSDLAIYDKRN